MYWKALLPAIFFWMMPGGRRHVTKTKNVVFELSLYLAPDVFDVAVAHWTFPCSLVGFKPRSG